jgi:hypothetical protein
MCLVNEYLKEYLNGYLHTWSVPFLSCAHLVLNPPTHAHTYPPTHPPHPTHPHTYPSPPHTHTSKQVSSSDIDRLSAMLVKELGALVDGPLRPAERAACMEALLYFQAAGVSTSLTPARLIAARGAGGAGSWGGGMQGALLAAVLKCAKARPKEASNFLGYGAAGVSGGGCLAGARGEWSGEAGTGWAVGAAVGIPG